MLRIRLIVCRSRGTVKGSAVAPPARRRAQGWFVDHA